MDWKAASRYFFAATMIGIGLLGLVKPDFPPIWGPIPKATPAGGLLPYLSTLVALVCGAGLLAKRTAGPAALMLTIFLILWTAAFKFPFIVRGPLVEGSYQYNGENWVMIAAAWILYTEFARRPKFPGGEAGERVAYLLDGLGLIAVGLSHFF